jgi:hypothetical protein
MLSTDEARVAYAELLQKLRSVGAQALAGEIEWAVGLGRVQERERCHMQEPLPAAEALATALRMLGAWIEPAFLVSEAEMLLREASNGRFDAVRWMADQLDVVAPKAPIDILPTADQAVMDIPSLGTSSDQFRGHLEHLQKLIADVVATEGE